MVQIYDEQLTNSSNLLEFFTKSMFHVVSTDTNKRSKSSNLHFSSSLLILSTGLIFSIFLYIQFLHVLIFFLALNPCAQELSTFTATQNGLPLLGAHKPLCDVDGYYQPKQCAGSQYVLNTCNQVQIAGRNGRSDFRI